MAISGNFKFDLQACSLTQGSEEHDGLVAQLRYKEQALFSAFYHRNPLRCPKNRAVFISCLSSMFLTPLHYEK